MYRNDDNICYHFRNKKHQGVTKTFIICLLFMEVLVYGYERDYC